MAGLAQGPAVPWGGAQIDQTAYNDQGEYEVDAGDGRAELERRAYPMPDGMDTHETLKYIFKHCCTFGRTSGDGMDAKTIDNANFIKMIKKAPGFLTKRVTTQHVDVVFTKCKPRGGRRLNYSRFLDALFQLGMVRYPDEDPVNAFTYMLTSHIFGLLASGDDGQANAGATVMKVKEELLSPPQLAPQEFADAYHRAEEESALALKAEAVGSVRYDPVAEGGDERVKKEAQRRRTVGKVIIAKKKWDEKKKAGQG